jgi:hypothetical protein
MIFSNLFASLIQIIFKPKIVVPAIAVLLVSVALTAVNGWALERPFVDLVLYYDTIPQDNLIGLLLINYPMEIASILIIGFIMMVATIIGVLSIARMARKAGLVDAINDSVSEWKKSFAAAIVFYAYLIILLGLMSLASWLSEINALLSVIAVIVIAIIAFVSLVKVIFIVPALIDKEIKKAVQESWRFTNKGFWRGLVFTLLAAGIAWVLWMILFQIGIFAGEAFEIPMNALGESVALAYFIAAITNYFYSKT